MGFLKVVTRKNNRSGEKINYIKVKYSKRPLQPCKETKFLKIVTRKNNINVFVILKTVPIIEFMGIKMENKDKESDEGCEARQYSNK